MGQIVEGRVMRRIKGGVMIDIGTRAFLPATQVVPRRPEGLDALLGQTLQVGVRRIDHQRRQIILSQKPLL